MRRAPRCLLVLYLFKALVRSISSVEESLPCGPETVNTDKYGMQKTKLEQNTSPSLFCLQSWPSSQRPSCWEAGARQRGVEDLVSSAFMAFESARQLALKVAAANAWPALRPSKCFAAANLQRLLACRVGWTMVLASAWLDSHLLLVGCCCGALQLMQSPAGAWRRYLLRMLRLLRIVRLAMVRRRVRGSSSGRGSARQSALPGIRVMHYHQPQPAS